MLCAHLSHLALILLSDGSICVKGVTCLQIQQCVSYPDPVISSLLHPHCKDFNDKYVLLLQYAPICPLFPHRLHLIVGQSRVKCDPFLLHSLHS